MMNLRLNRFVFVSLLVGVGCASDDLKPPVDCSTEGPAVTVTEVGEAECGESNGFIAVAATGGSGTYEYSINGGPFGEEPFFESLSSGSYTIIVRDENGCEASVLQTVTNKEGVNLSLASTDAGCGTAAGTITVTPDGGEGPYEYSIDGGPFQADPTFTGLAAGEYTVTIRDATDCESFQVVRVKSGISFAADIQPIITSSCAINDCHNGNQFPDFRVFKNIQDNAANIKKLTGDRTMPDEGTLTQAQIDAIACWVDDGAIQN
ncbi:MAG TPA: hypothetical protein VIL31_16665 [Cyclobacteriaceae bacterium]